ncbi:MAG: pantothenate kinase [Candidatus Syntrophoarchaeum caldarius]|uniref:Pantoate kinase n=1 Tax=Candidatus Syntropharchaeum caldarium TaxID=1838285 RepID=A0A1F2PAP6_9EURY|nr:MAG: pantothenate kinase [Candidatus Syntrophoarchaeum caldarius]
MHDQGRIVWAWAPSHITGFFSIHRDPNPLLSGSCGCGIVLEAGCEVKASLSDEYEIFVNGSRVDARTTMHVLTMLANQPVRLECFHQTPVGGGFGASAASALATAYALNELLNLGKTGLELAQIAHIAEVDEVTGFGDVIAAERGGVVIRKRAGGPGFGILDTIPSIEYEVFYVILGGISTKAILTEEETVNAINHAGKIALKKILKRPTFQRFMQLSKEFADATGLLSLKARDAIEAVESTGGMASMAMLGDTVFAVGGKEVRSVLDAFGEVGVSKITHSGARLDGYQTFTMQP